MNAPLKTTRTKENKMKIVQTEMTGNGMETYIVRSDAEEVQLLVKILGPLSSLNPVLVGRVERRFWMTQPINDLLEIKREAFPHLPEKMRIKAEKAHDAYDALLKDEIRKNESKWILREIVYNRIPLTTDHLSMLLELSEVAKRAEHDNIAYSGGYGRGKTVYRELEIATV